MREERCTAEPGEVSSMPRGHSPQPVFLSPSLLQGDGVFATRVDDGLDVRKAAFECMYSLLESCLGQLDVCEFLNHVEDGLKDHYDIRVGGPPDSTARLSPTPAPGSPTPAPGTPTRVVALFSFTFGCTVWHVGS